MKYITAAAVMTAVAVHPSTLSQKPLTCFPMIARLFPTSMTRSIRGGGASRLLWDCWSSTDRMDIAGFA